MKVYSTSLTKKQCESVFDLVINEDFGETGEAWIEDSYFLMEVYPIGLTLAPERLENQTVRMDLTGRDCGGAASCYVGYSITVK